MMRPLTKSLNAHPAEAMTDIVERLRSSEPLPACPFDRISPLYLKMPDDKPCPVCGQENTLEGPDKCRGADTRIMGEAANEIDHLRKALQKIVETTDDGCVEELAERALELPQVGKQK